MESKVFMELLLIHSVLEKELMYSWQGKNNLLIIFNSKIPTENMRFRDYELSFKVSQD